MNYSKKIVEKINTFSELEIIDANALYKNDLSDVPVTSFYKVLSRMEQDGSLARITKGIYCIPKQGRFDTLISKEKDITDYYLGEKENKGIYTGYRLFNKYSLSTQISKTVQLISNVIDANTKKVLNVSIKKTDVEFNKSTAQMMELLEVLENYKKIENLDYKMLFKYIKDTLENYDEDKAEKIIETMNYKKSTLASLEKAANFFNIKNNLSKYLNKTSTYKSINMEELYEFTS